MIKYYAMLVPGLEDVAWTEIQSKLKDTQLIEKTRGRLLFSCSDEPEYLLRLRSVANIFIFIGNITGLTRSRNSLGDIFRRVGNADLEIPLRLHKQVHGGKGKKRITFRVVSNMLGRHNFRRVDAQNSVESALEKKYGWRLSLETPTLEFRIDLEEDTALLGLRLTDERMKKRYKTAHIPGSLMPTVAHCMVLLSEPETTDVFIDPMCGAGTIAIERALAGPYQRVLAGDIEENAIHSAKDNIAASHKPVDLMLWDVSILPLHDHSVDKIVTNLPFGKQTGSQIENRSLYMAFFKEMKRILKQGGKAVLLSTERDIIRELTARNSSIKRTKMLKIDLLGLKAGIYVIDFR